MSLRWVFHSIKILRNGIILGIIMGAMLWILNLIISAEGFGRENELVLM